MWANGGGRWHELLGLVFNAADEAVVESVDVGELRGLPSYQRATAFDKAVIRTRLIAGAGWQEGGNAAGCDQGLDAHIIGPGLQQEPDGPVLCRGPTGPWSIRDALDVIDGGGKSLVDQEKIDSAAVAGGCQGGSDDAIDECRESRGTHLLWGVLPVSRHDPWEGGGIEDCG